MQTIFKILDELGYNVSWAIYNSKDYGVPQNRERIFIKGYLRDECGQKVLSVPRVNRTVNASVSNTFWGTRAGRIHKGDEIMNCLATQGHNGGGSQLIQLNNAKSQANRVYDVDGLSVTISSSGGGLGGKTGLYNVNKVGNINPSKSGMNGNVYSDEGVSPTLTTNKGEGLKIIEKEKRAVQKLGNVSPSNHWRDDIISTDGISKSLTRCDYKSPIKIAQPVLTPDRENKRQNGRRMKENGEPMFTLTAQDKHGVYDGYLLRKLTPVECERLQGFPDNWTKYGKDGELISDTQRYKCCGNAVTTNVITAIVNEMFDNLN